MVIKFEDYVNVIRKQAYKYAKHYNVDYDDVLSEGYLIFCECVDSYDVSKSSFITFLFSSLKALQYYAYKQAKLDSALEINDNGDVVIDVDTKFSLANKSKPTFNDLIDYANEYLDDELMEVFSYIISYEWEKPYTRKINVSVLCDKFDYTRRKACDILLKLKEFYNCNLKYAFGYGGVYAV